MTAYLYYLLGEHVPFDGHYENLQAACSWGFKISGGMKKVTTLQGIYDFIDYWDVERKEPACGYRRHRAEGQLPEAERALAIRQSPVGHCLQVSGGACPYAPECCNLPGRTYRNGDAGGQYGSGAVGRYGRTACHSAQCRRDGAVGFTHRDMVYVEKEGKSFPKSSVWTLMRVERKRVQGPSSSPVVRNVGQTGALRGRSRMVLSQRHRLAYRKSKAHRALHQPPCHEHRQPGARNRDDYYRRG